ncbi:MAG: 16S rRNA (adenine(1518)-N(6)/adenine(1519)-N(6))-dimethyltransferase RsmA [Gemmatimonadales bacterium]
MGRRLGQHFLRDTAMLDRIVDAIDPQPDDVVIEIGPGEGSLTARLIARVGHVVAIEKDPQLAERLRATCTVQRAAGNTPTVTVIEGDALELDWTASLHGARCTVHGLVKVIGNIPYYITTPLIERALEGRHPVIVFLTQKEVADRVVAAPGGKEYGALSVGVQAVAKAERLFVVKAGAFHPPPKVDSAVLRLTPRPDPLITEPERAPFRRFVAAVFGQRRKQLGRSLRDVAGCSRDEAQSVLIRVGIAPTDRGETLTPERFVTLFRTIALTS